MRKIATSMICVLVSFGAFAQTAGKVSGVVNDDAGKPLASATISLLKAKDSGLVKVALTNKDGQYEFFNIKEGKYLMSATSVGYGKKLSAVFDVASGGCDGAFFYVSAIGKKHG